MPKVAPNSSQIEIWVEVDPMLGEIMNVLERSGTRVLSVDCVMWETSQHTRFYF